MAKQVRNPVAKKQIEYSSRITVAEANDIIRKFVGVPFRDLADFAEIKDLKTDKGLVGKILERKIGIPNSNAQIDLADGELKTNKCNVEGLPKERIFITQIKTQFDNIIAGQEFEETHLFKKIQRLLYVPVCKDGEQANWFFFPPILVDLNSSYFENIKKHLKSDHRRIVDQLKRHIEVDGEIHTANGTLIQVRTKDYRPYSPIFSKIYDKEIANKNYAFYFLPVFGTFLQLLSSDYPYRQNIGRISKVTLKKIG